MDTAQNGSPIHLAGVTRVFQTMELLGGLHRANATICMLTHDQRFARHAVRTSHLVDGQIVDEEGRPEAAVAPARQGR